MKNMKKMPVKDLFSATISVFSIKNLSLIIKILGRRPGPEKIIGAKFDIVKQMDIKAFADDIRLSVYS
jgi:hypothetical protein